MQNFENLPPPAGAEIYHIVYLRGGFKVSEGSVKEWYDKYLGGKLQRAHHEWEPVTAEGRSNNLQSMGQENLKEFASEEGELVMS